MWYKQISGENSLKKEKTEDIPTVKNNQPTLIPSPKKKNTEKTPKDKRNSAQYTK